MVCVSISTQTRVHSHTVLDKLATFFIFAVDCYLTGPLGRVMTISVGLSSVGGEIRDVSQFICYEASCLPFFPLGGKSGK